MAIGCETCNLWGVILVRKEQVCHLVDHCTCMNECMPTSSNRCMYIVYVGGHLRRIHKPHLRDR